MYLASLSRLPSTPVLPIRSLPARSTRCSLDRRTTELPGALATDEGMRVGDKIANKGNATKQLMVKPTDPRFSNRAANIKLCPT